ncbi:EAL domain-containing protein [Marinobacter mobilis]|uniref:Diguanylate cyclase (GGDEF) domain-containing protein n=1 Tax=Marinobacter mobilis TaxID=488533 RepID=A0A1H2XNQ1_9GAMM|nr:EAL domain-containing protein [Marinobacter mobilis]SDW94487.1 diguanylate cyclase (GGDEF) domain-containing protein [Marinobacter mobilis]
MKEFFIRRYRSESGQGEGRRTLIRVDDRGVITHADSNAEAVLGHDARQLIDQPITRIVAARQDDPFSSSQRHRFSSGQPVIITLRHKDGFFFTAEVALRLEEKDSDQPASAQIVMRESQSLDPRLLQLVEASGELGIWELDLHTNRVSWSEGIYNLMELRSNADITPEQALFYCQTRQTRVRALIRRCISRGQPFAITFELITSRQRIRRVRLTGRAIRSGDQIVKLGGTLVDQSREMEQEQAAHQARTLLAAIVGATPDLVAAVDTELKLLCCNEAYSRHFQKAFGRLPVVGQCLSTQLQAFPNERRLMERLWHRAFERDGFAVEMPLTSQRDNAQVYEVHYQKLNSPDGESIGAVHVARDITERIRTSGSRNYLNTHDPITGLLNRRELVKRMSRLLEQTELPSSALLYIDLDHFAKFNDSLGNGICDRYLRELANALGLKVRQRDALARLAGDTFVLLLENCSDSEARKVSRHLLELIQGFDFEWKGENLSTTASAGLLILGERLPEDPEQLLAQAADLCHTAKVAGRNRLHAASADSKALREGEARKLLAHLQHSLDNNQIQLAYQMLRPVASATWGDHIEILARLNGIEESDDWILPATFLPIAERFDLAKRLDRQVIRQTLAWLSDHILLEPRLKYCGFNLSLATVLDDSFGDFLQDALASSRFNRDCFCMEIREAHAIQYPDEVAVLCDTLHALGCRVALDGASVSSYTLAARLPVDIIKLDQALTGQLHQDPIQLVMAEAMHKIASSAGKLTIATGIEHDDSLRKARALGLHFGQGYRLHKPQPLEALAPVQWDVSQPGV